MADTTNVSIDIDPPDVTTLCAGDTVTVRVTYQFPTVTPLSNLIFASGTIPIYSETAATVLTPACP
jgi:hypothetical protein